MGCDFIISERKTLSLADRDESEDLIYNKSYPLLKGNVDSYINITIK